MLTATAFRTALGTALVCFLLALGSIVNHFVQPANAHPFVGLKLGLLLLLVAMACATYANYNRPSRG